MTPVTAAAGQHLALFGLGGSGLATAQALLAGGARVTAWDDGPGARDAAAAAGVTVADLREEAAWSDVSALVLAPGVPLTHPVPHWTVPLARAAGVPIIGDIELFCRERALRAPDAPFIAVTGTNGKSTTTALVAHLLRAAGWIVQMGGNIGVPALQLEPPAKHRVHVLELSSFQIDLAPSLKVTVGILTNITPDHIDRHGSLAGYAAIKERLVAAADHALIGIDDDPSRAIYERARARRGEHRAWAVSVTGSPPRNGIGLQGTAIVATAPGKEPLRLGDLDGTATLRGRHNGQNACCAAGAAHLLGVGADEGSADGLIQRGLRTFPGLPHRMEPLGQQGRVLFVNDSKATNAEAAAQSLGSFRDIHWIAGGVAKEGGIASLAPLFPHVTKAYLIGSSADAFATTLEGTVKFERCGTLDRAVDAAAADAARSPAPEPVVLLAPACASYDQFANFEVRGDAFRAAVARLGDPP